MGSVRANTARTNVIEGDLRDIYPSSFFRASTLYCMVANR